MKVIFIDSLDAEEIEFYTKYNENQLYHANEPDIGYFIAESPEVINRALAAGYEPVSFLVEEENMSDSVIRSIEKTDVPVYVGKNEILCKLTGYGLTRGMLCLFKRKPLANVEDIIGTWNNIAILEDVMNPTNVGAIVRSAAALNIDGIIFTNGCADPLYRRAARVSMGTIFQIPWTFVDKKEKWPLDVVSLLKSKGYSIIAMALKDDTFDIRDSRLHEQTKKAIILGTEGTGIKDETLEMCDFTVKIPMSHGVDSLNVAAASAVAFYALAN